MRVALLLCSMAVSYVLSLPVLLVPSHNVSTPIDTTISSIDATMGSISTPPVATTDTSVPNIFSVISNATALTSLIQSKNFLSDMAHLDPSAINNIITLLRQLVASNTADINRYATDESAAKRVKEAKTLSLGTFQGQLSASQAKLKATQDQEITDQDDVNSKQDHVNTASAALKLATDKHTQLLNLKISEGGSLTSEITTLNEVIVKLQEIATGYSVSCDTATQRKLKDYCYATLGSTNPAASNLLCQNTFIDIPSGWEIPIMTQEIINAIVKPFGWQTSCLCVVGQSYYTATYQAPGNGCGNALVCNGISCKVNGCNRQILIRRRSRQ